MPHHIRKSAYPRGERRFLDSGVCERRLSIVFFTSSRPHIVYRHSHTHNATNRHRPKSCTDFTTTKQDDCGRRRSRSSFSRSRNRSRSSK